mgnify:CR=1 FL=1
MNFLPVILIVTFIGVVWWVFSTFALLDIFTALFVVGSLVVLSIGVFAVVGGGVSKNG